MELNQRQALIAACRANKEDDLPRLVFADYLDETGSEKDAARATAIRIGVEAAKLRAVGHGGKCPIIWSMHEQLIRGGQANPSCSLCDDLAAMEYRERELQSANSDGVLDVWDRGFITKVIATAEWWLQHGDDLVREHDVQRVRLTTLPEVEIVSNDRNAEYHVALRLAKNRVSVVMPRGFLSRYQGSPTVAAANSLLRAHWPSVAEWELPSRLTAQATWGPVVIEPRAFVYATVT